MFVINTKNIDKYDYVFDIFSKLYFYDKSASDIIKIFDHFMLLNVINKKTKKKTTIISKYNNIMNLDNNDDNKFMHKIHEYVDEFIGMLYWDADIFNHVANHMITNYSTLISLSVRKKLRKNDKLPSIFEYSIRHNSISIFGALINIIGKDDLLLQYLFIVVRAYITEYHPDINVDFAQYLIGLIDQLTIEYEDSNVKSTYICLKKDIILGIFHNSLYEANSTETFESIYSDYIENKMDVDIINLIKQSDVSNVEYMLDRLNSKHKLGFYRYNIESIMDFNNIQDVNKLKLCINLVKTYILDPEQLINKVKNKLKEYLMLKSRCGGHRFPCFIEHTKCLELLKVIEEHEHTSNGYAPDEYISELFVNCVKTVNWQVVEYIMEKYKHINL